jgi:hypothetical protein
VTHGQKVALSTLVAVIVAAGWLFRYDYLPPVVYQDTASLDNPTGRSIVVCKVNRWTAYVACHSVIADIDQIVESVERRVQEQRRK